MSDRIKVLNINKVSDEFGGVPIFLMNVHSKMDHNKYQLDFLTPDTTSYNPWRKEIERENENIFEFHINCNSVKKTVTFYRRLRSFLLEHPYDIVHIHCGAVLFDCLTAMAVKSKQVKIIVHSHNAGARNWLKSAVVFFVKCIMQRKANLLCACSKAAGQHLFTNHACMSGDVIIINNGIDLQKFRYDLKIRNKVRKELSLENHFIVGHIGRFAEQKNHTFLVDIFVEILREKPEAILLLVGKGEMEELIHEKVCSLNIEKNVIFLGQRDDTKDLYQAMDMLLFPSLYEGLPITLVEAQASGLPCYISDTITKEVDLTQLIHRISLKESASKWAQDVLSSIIDIDQRCSYEQELSKAGFGIETSVAQIAQIYKNLMHVRS